MVFEETQTYLKLGLRPFLQNAWCVMSFGCAVILFVGFIDKEGGPQLCFS